MELYKSMGNDAGVVIEILYFHMNMNLLVLFVVIT